MLLAGVVEIGNEKERGENVRSLVDCYVIQEDECAVEPGFEGPTRHQDQYQYLA